jgi:hypothetical protein
MPDFSPHILCDVFATGSTVAGQYLLVRNAKNPSLRVHHKPSNRNTRRAAKKFLIGAHTPRPQRPLVYRLALALAAADLRQNFTLRGAQ